MTRAAAFLSVGLSLLVAADAILTTALAQPPGDGIVLVQDRQQAPGIFRFLFRNRREQAPPRLLLPRRIAPAPGDEVRPRRQREAARPRREREASRPRRERRNRPAAVPQVAAVEKAANAKRILVMGDFMAGALSKGLVDAYAQNPNIVVVDASSGSSGLVRADFYDWPGQVPALVEAQKPDAILVLVGANDRQSIQTDAGAQAIGSDRWRAAYAARVGAFADALKATGKPVLWAGLAPVRQNAMSRDYSTMNDILREQLEARGLRYVETWNGFANEEGRFIAEGPDVGGQTVQLRDSDGLNFTRAGQRKLAFFVEQELTNILGGAAPQLAAADPAAMPLDLDSTEAGPRIGPMVPIDALSVGGEALSAGAPAAESSGSGAVLTAISKRLGGEEAIVPPNARVDSYAWPPPDAAAAAPTGAAILPPPQLAPLTGPPPALASPAAPPASP